MKRRKKRLKKKYRRIRFYMFLIIVIVAILFGKNLYNKYQDKLEQIRIQQEEERKRQEKIAQQKKDYEACLIRKYDDNDDTEYLLDKEEELTSYLKSKYNLSVKMYDKNTGYTYSYQSTKNYYAASTIKMLDALYIYQKAFNNELDLDSGKTFDRVYGNIGSPLGMSKRKVGEKVSLRDLVKYAIMYSDNAAHHMLVDYIGFNELKSYGKSLGATTTLVGGDKFGHIDANDSIVYIKALDEFIDSSGDLGQELKQYFVDSDQNYLKIEEENIDAAQKYGEFGYNYHSNGIVYAPNIYYISILTLEGKSRTIAEDVNKRVYELQQAFYENREKVCLNEVYGNE